MTIEAIEVDSQEVARNATLAALDVIDAALHGGSKKSSGPCGDELAFSLDKLIKAAIDKHLDNTCRSE